MAMNFPKQAVHQAAKRHGYTVESLQTGSVFTIRVDAPRGRHFANGLHCLVNEGRVGSALDRDKMWIDMLERLETGTTECDLNDDDCASANDM